MRQIIVLVAVAIALAGLGGAIRTNQGTAAQEATPALLAGHPLVGSWLVDSDTTTETNAPGFGVWTSDGIMMGLGDTSFSGTWEAGDERTGLVSFVNIMPDGGGYVVVRGPHTVDDTGQSWTAPYSWTVVSPDGTIIDSGESTARGIRISEDSSLTASAPYAVGSPLAVMPTWSPAATPTS